MKNKLIIFSAIACVLALSACTSNTSQNTTTNNTVANTTASPKAATNSASMSAAPNPSFPATSDSDVKAIDKYFDNSKTSDFDDKSLNDLSQ